MSTHSAGGKLFADGEERMQASVLTFSKEIPPLFVGHGCLGTFSQGIMPALEEHHLHANGLGLAGNRVFHFERTNGPL